MSKDSSPSRWSRIADRAVAFWQYCSDGVWTDHRDNLKVNTIKTINLTVRTFLSTDLQNKAYALTYQTLLAIVPALALLFAIGRGFGFQNMLQSQLFQYLPSQHKALEMAFSFVDSCLAQASEGVFVGVGIVFLLWTIISLLDNVEETFNTVWGVTVDRSFFRKVTDYLAICIILPILMICSGGLQVFMSSMVQKLLPNFLSPVLEFFLDCASVMLSWLFFAGAYTLIPNAKVKFKNALLAGVLAGTGFQILQWLFLSGQLYVAKYNAIYGSFSFLPLMLIWMQLSWLITLAGALICCSAQNISMFTYDRQTRTISRGYRHFVAVSILTLIVRRHNDALPPLTVAEISRQYAIPARLVYEIVNRLISAGLLVRVLPEGDADADPTILPVQPSLPIEKYTLNYVNHTLDSYGASSFMDSFDSRFENVARQLGEIAATGATRGDIMLKDIDFKPYTNTNNNSRQ